MSEILYIIIFVTIKRPITKIKCEMKVECKTNAMWAATFYCEIEIANITCVAVNIQSINV